MLLDIQNPFPQQKQSHVSSGNNLGFGTTKHSLVTLDLFDTRKSPPRLEFFDIKSKQKRGLEEDQGVETIMSKTTPKLDLRLNLSPTRANQRGSDSPSRSASISPQGSCLSSDTNPEDQHSNIPETTSMVLVGCPRCLMYVMLSEDNPKCPKCKSTVLLDFLHGNNNNNNNNIGCSKKTRKN